MKTVALSEVKNGLAVSCGSRLSRGQAARVIIG